jgi:hypothetical protein
MSIFRFSLAAYLFFQSLPYQRRAAPGKGKPPEPRFKRYGRLQGGFIGNPDSPVDNQQLSPILDAILESSSVAAGSR